MSKFIIIASICLLFIYKNAFSNLNQHRILKYLESFISLKSEFIQINNNGDVLSGSVIILRPGKIRVEYNEMPLLLISDGKKIATINKEIRSVSYFNLEDLPISLLLFDNLSEKVKFSRIKELDNQIRVQLNKKDSDSLGFVEIIFESNPFLMKKWTIYNNQQKTEVLLNNLQLNTSYDSKLFNIEKEDPKRKFFGDN